MLFAISLYLQLGLSVGTSAIRLCPNVKYYTTTNACGVRYGGMYNIALSLLLQSADR